ncbi:IS200/IS605 family accessory protein TnpB-related protein [Streptomyces sp. NPDC002992]|uniref:IS200/IS605 family accessory protein TnpB-related protein n=1 Tax=Streptomyces sp. NPDC002992 TaxID=3154273 RepID=UPI0033BB28BB
MPGLRAIAPTFVVSGPTGVAIRDRLKHLTVGDEQVLRLVGDYQGMLASRDLKARCADGLDHSAETWAARKRELTGFSSSRIAGSITKATHDQWALARRCLAAHIRNLEAGIRMLRHRLSLPIRQRCTKRAAGGYRSKSEWFRKSRRLAALEARLEAARADWQSGRVRVVRGGRRLLNSRHHLADAQLTEEQWRERWEAERWFLSADGESGKRFGNETIRVTPDGEVSIKLPAPLAHLANTRHGRYVFASTVTFVHRGEEWRDRVEANRAVAYRIHLDVDRGRWYVTASWQPPVVQTIPLEAARASGMIGVAAIAVEDLDFAAEKTREKHGRRKRFRQLISGIPTGKLKARLVSMAAELGLAIVAVDPAYTTQWGGRHWQKPLVTPRREMSRHDAVGIAIGRRALGHPIRRRTAPPRDDQSDRHGHRTAQARPGARGREGTRPPVTDHAPRDVPPNGKRKRRPSASTTVRDTRSDQLWVQDSLLLT